MSIPLVQKIAGIPIIGGVFGMLGFPPRPPIPLPDIDERTHALRAFADYIATLQFRRSAGAGKEPITFRIPRTQIYIEQPDNVEDMKFPAIAFIPGRGRYESFGLGPPNIKDDTIDKFAPGTALLESAEYKERFILEAWGSKIGERRAIVAGLHAALLRQESSYALRILLPDLYGTSAEFALVERENIDGPDAVRNRRRGHFHIDLTVCVLQLVNVVTMRPMVVTEVCDGPEV